MIIKSETGNLVEKAFYLVASEKRKEWMQEGKRDAVQSSTEWKYFIKRGGRL